LLKRQQVPKCEYRTPALSEPARPQLEGSPPPGSADPDAAMRTKLDYERQCYKHAEMITRARLTELQKVVERAANRRDGDWYHP
jgi:hypothetical protein